MSERESGRGWKRVGESESESENLYGQLKSPLLFPFIYQYAGISPSCVSGGGNWQYFVTFGSGGGAGFGGGG